MKCDSCWWTESFWWRFCISHQTSSWQTHKYNGWILTSQLFLCPVWNIRQVFGIICHRNISARKKKKKCVYGFSWILWWGTFSPNDSLQSTNSGNPGLVHRTLRNQSWWLAGAGRNIGESKLFWCRERTKQVTSSSLQLHVRGKGGKRLGGAQIPAT